MIITSLLNYKTNKPYKNKSIISYYKMGYYIKNVDTSYGLGQLIYDYGMKKYNEGLITGLTSGLTIGISIGMIISYLKK